MADDFSNDEYEFHEVTARPAPAGASQNPFASGSAASLLDVLSKKRVFLVGLIVFVSFLGYKLAGVFFETRKHYQSAPRPKIHLTEVKPVAKITPPVIEKPVENIHEGETRLTQVETKISNIEQETTLLNNNLQKLSQLLSQQQQLLMDLREKDKSAVKKPIIHETPKVALPEYVVTAIIPGRAWLLSDKKESVTVSSGDKLLGYGRVETVDSRRGVVITTSGRTIQFAPDDR